MNHHGHYWNPFIETLPVERLRELQLKKFKRGAWSYECTEQPGGLHVNEAFFLVEIEDLETGEITDDSRMEA